MIGNNDRGAVGLSLAQSLKRNREFLIRFLVLTTILALTLTMVCQVPQREPSSIVLKELVDCSSPCWHGIQPAKTTLLEFKSALSNLQKLDVVWHVETVSEGSYHIYERKPLQTSTHVLIHNGIVIGLTRRFQKSATVQDYLAFLGPPELLIQPLTEAERWPNHPDGSPFDQLGCADTTATNIIAQYPYPRTIGMVFPAKGVTLWINRAEEFANTLCPDFEVVGAMYYQPTTLAELVNMNQYSASGGMLDAYAQYDWVGFGSHYGLKLPNNDAD